MQFRRITNRRQFLRLSALGAAGALLAACANQPTAAPTTAPAPTQASAPTTAPAPTIAPAATPTTAAKPTAAAATSPTAAAAAKPTTAAAGSPTAAAAAASPTAASATTPVVSNKPSYTVPTFALKLGFLGPLTGDVKTFGESTRNAFQMAVDENNANGGKITVSINDDKNDATEAVNAVNKMITQDGVKAIVGSVTSKCTIPAGDTANSNKIPLVTPTATSPLVTVADNKRKEYIFRVCFIDDFQGPAMANYVLNTLKLKSAAVLYDKSNAYSSGLAGFFKDAFAKNGGTVPVFESYGTNDVDFSAILTKVQSAKPDFLYLPDYYNKVNLIAQQARQKGITAVMGGGDGWDSPDLKMDITEGSFFTNHYSPDDPRPEVQAWVAKYKAKFNVVPDALATLAYDATNVLLAAAGQAGSADSTKIKDALVALQDFPAVSGKISFDKNGNPKKPITIVGIKGGKYTFAGSVAAQ
jgi:branched-chain amino acid transport system substrate-binding protein